MLLGSIMYSLVSVVLAGMLLLLAVVMGYDDIRSVVLAIAVGLVVALPATYYVTLRLRAAANK